jgi:hypothetical protein
MNTEPEAPGAAQSDAAAERSMPTRAEPQAPRPRLPCLICGKPGALFAARVLPPMVQVCSAACAAHPRYARPAVVAYAEPYAAGLETAARLAAECAARVGKGPQGRITGTMLAVLAETLSENAREALAAAGADLPL